MREQILRKFTQIPDHLYVKRKADDQVKRNIEEMLRPGYVSVARQMGKTNLLQYAQRTLEAPNQVIVYIDVTSSHYDDVRDYFHYIIDTIIESSSNNFNQYENEVRHNRNTLKLAPAKEHQNELKFLLKKFDGKIIIILDEVDSLVKYEFSDQIFAQIRSIYFMKNTFKEFNRISYLLSGVIEPNRIIKSKENSPFNIAQKLYLDDFTKEEFSSFISKCQLDILPSKITDRIYHWTSGNPRMTYDICAEVESLFIKNATVSEQQVDQIVEDIYLLRYDQAPIDHIRDLLYNNVLLRNAVQDIRRKNSISDDLKSQLYLYGVINSDFDKPQIKNLIVDKALSDEWIASIEIDNRGLYQYGLDCIRNKQFIEAINALTKFIDENTNSNKIPLAKYHLGLSHKESGEYELSNKYLSPPPLEEGLVGKSLYRGQFFMLGLNYWYLKDDDNAEKYYKLAIDQNLLDEEHLYSLFNLSLVYNRTGKLDDAINLNRRLINDIEHCHNITETTVSKLISSANYSIGKIQERLNNKDAAIISYDKALQYAQAKSKPSILLRRHFVSNSDEQRVNDLIEAIDLVIDNNLTIEENDSAITIKLSKDDITSLLLASCLKEETSEKFESLLSYASLNIDKVSREESLLDVVLKLNEIGLHNNALRYAYKVIEGDISIELRTRTFKYLVMLNRHLKKPYMALFSQYYDLLKQQNSVYEPDTTDINVLSNVTLDLWNRKEYRTSLKYAKEVINTINNKLPSMQPNRALMLYIIAESNFKLGNVLDAKMFALDCKNLIYEIQSNIEDLSGNEAAFISSIVLRVEELISATTSINNNVFDRPTTAIDYTKLGRNDNVKVKYLNGPVKSGKYKMFERDVKSNLCLVIEKM